MSRKKHPCVCGHSWRHHLGNGHTNARHCTHPTTDDPSGYTIDAQGVERHPQIDVPCPCLKYVDIRKYDTSVDHINERYDR